MQDLSDNIPVHPMMDRHHSDVNFFKGLAGYKHLNDTKVFTPSYPQCRIDFLDHSFLHDLRQPKRVSQPELRDEVPFKGIRCHCGTQYWESGPNHIGFHRLTEVVVHWKFKVSYSY